MTYETKEEKLNRELYVAAFSMTWIKNAQHKSYLEGKDCQKFTPVILDKEREGEFYYIPETREVGMACGDFIALTDNCHTDEPKDETVSNNQHGLAGFLKPAFDSIKPKNYLDSVDAHSMTNESLNGEFYYIPETMEAAMACGECLIVKDMSWLKEWAERNA